MERLFLASVLFFVCADLSAARSQEPVVITTCRSFGARCDEQSKIALQNRFKPLEEQNCGDCDDINKVCANAVSQVRQRSRPKYCANHTARQAPTANAR